MSKQTKTTRKTNPTRKQDPLDQECAWLDRLWKSVVVTYQKLHALSEDASRKMDAPVSIFGLADHAIDGVTWSKTRRLIRWHLHDRIRVNIYGDLVTVPHYKVATDEDLAKALTETMDFIKTEILH